MPANPQSSSLPVPHDIETEQALIGALMMDNRQFEAVSGYLRWHHFAEPLHQRIYDQMLRMHKKGMPVNPVSMKPFALKDEPMKTVGGVDYLHNMIRMTPYAGAAPEFAQAIYNMAKRRDIVEIADTLKQQAIDMQPDETPSALVEQMSGKLIEVDMAATAHQPVSGSRAASDALEEAWHASQHGRPPGLALGLKDLDETLGGAQPGDLIVVAGRPGMGKSAFCTSVASRIARRGDGVLYISCEMTAPQIGRRIVSEEVRRDGHNLPYRVLRAGKIDMSQYERARAVLEAMGQVPLIIDDRRNPSVEQIVASAKMTSRNLAKVGKRLSLVVVDHLQLIASPGDYRGNRVSEMTEISKQMKVLGRDLGIPVIACSQLNRDVESRQNKNKRPILRDLRESGSIEQDADMVLMLYREEYYALQDKPDRSDGSAWADWEYEFEKVKNQLDVIVAKNREGDQTTVKLHCEMAYSAINDWRGHR